MPDLAWAIPLPEDDDETRIFSLDHIEDAIDARQWPTSNEEREKVDKEINSLKYEIKKARLKPGIIYSYRGVDRRITIQLIDICLVQQWPSNMPSPGALCRGFLPGSESHYFMRFLVAPEFLRWARSERGLRRATKDDLRKHRKMLAKCLLKQ